MKLTGRREPGSGSRMFAGVSAPVRNDDPTRNDPTSVAFELVGTPAIFGFLGHLADRALGTGPIIMLSAGFVAFVTVLCLVIWRYNNDMDHAVAEHREVRAQKGPRRARWEHDPVDEPVEAQGSSEVSA